MNSLIIILLAVAAVGRCRDLIKGEENNGTKIFDKTLEASPAIWRQEHNVTVNTTEDELINKIIVKDLRPYKDGEVNIVDGGEGESTVTFELKSPTALRGYSFQIEVFAANKNEINPLKDQTNRHRIQRNTSEMPTSNEPKTNSDETKTPEVIIKTTEKHSIESSTLPTTVHSNPTVQPMVPSVASLDVSNGFGGQEKNLEKDTFSTPKANPIQFDYPPSEVVKAANKNNHPRNSRDTESHSITEDSNLMPSNSGMRPAQVYNPPNYNHTVDKTHPIVLPINLYRGENNPQSGPQYRPLYKEENSNTGILQSAAPILSDQNKNTPTATKTKRIETLKPLNDPNENKDSLRNSRDTKESTEQPKIIGNPATTQKPVKIVPGIHEIPEKPQENKPYPKEDLYHPGAATAYHPTTTPKALRETDDPFTKDFPKAVMV